MLHEVDQAPGARPHPLYQDVPRLPWTPGGYGAGEPGPLVFARYTVLWTRLRQAEAAAAFLARWLARCDGPAPDVGGRTDD